MGQHPIVKETVGKISENKAPVVLVAHKKAETIMTIRRKLKAAYQESMFNTAKYYNKKIKPMTYRIGDKIWLSGKNRTTIRPCKKLDSKFHGLFWVLGIVGKNAYQLKLPPRLKIHPMFYVLLREPANKT